MAATLASTLARGLIGLAAIGAGAAASANDAVGGALLGAGAGAIIGHAIGGPDAAAVGGVVGAVAGAATASGHAGVSVHYSPGYAYVPAPVYRPLPPPVYVVPQPLAPLVIYVPNRGYGYWHHGHDAWGRPHRHWVPAAPPRFHPAPVVSPYHYHRGPPAQFHRPPPHHHRGYDHRGSQHGYRR